MTSHDEELGAILQADLDKSHVVRLRHGPVDMAFHPDGRGDTVLLSHEFSFILLQPM